MSQYYTGKGDDGSTSIIKERVSKNDPIIDLMGDIDELNSYLGVSLFYINREEIRKELFLIQNDLFILGADIASIKHKDSASKNMEKEELDRLEKSIESIARKLPELKKFVLPNGCEGATHLHFARSVARRMERKLVNASKKYDISKDVLAYANRLSSYLFVAALYINFLEGVKETNPFY